MPSRRTETCPKAAISVSEMASLCGLSRSRLYELIADGVMPSPVYDLRTRRPFFTPELQAACMQVKATNLGVNGQFVLFYAQRERPASTAVRPSARPSLSSGTRAVPEGMTETLRMLGLADTTDAQVGAALRHCFPEGVNGRDESDIIRAVFQRLRSVT